MPIKNPENINNNHEKKSHHDILASIRFLEHLYHEIDIAKNIDEIKDPSILNKLKETISILTIELIEKEKKKLKN